MASDGFPRLYEPEALPVSSIEVSQLSSGGVRLDGFKHGLRCGRVTVYADRVELEVMTGPKESPSVKLTITEEMMELILSLMHDDQFAVTAPAG